MENNIIDIRLEKFTIVINKGVTLFKNKKFKESIKKYIESLKYTYGSQEAKALAYYYMGLSNMGLRDFPAAISDFKQALSYSDNKQYYYDLGLAYLSNNNLQEGLKLYKYRYFRQNEETPQFPALPLPFYQGLDFNEYAGKNVLVYREQGLGDEFLFSNAIPHLSFIAPKVLIQVSSSNLEFFQNHFERFENVKFFSNHTFTIEEVQEFDICTAFGNVFYQHFLRYPVDVIENKVELADDLKPDNIKVGFCISGNPETRDYDEKRIKLNDFLNLMETTYPDTNIDYYNLDIHNEYDFSTNIKDLSSSMYETSLIIKTLDVVYSIDTAILHLSHILRKDAYHLLYNYKSWIWNYNFYGTKYKSIVLTK